MKKKKKKNSNMLILGLVGGGLLLVGGVVLVVVLNPPKEKEQQPKFEPKPKKGKDLVSTVARRIEMIDVQQCFSQLGKAIQADSTINGKGTANYKELGPNFANSPLKEWIEKDWVKVVWSANFNNLVNGASNTALAWETDADSRGLRVVLMCDTSVQTMDENTFKNTPRAVGR
jgi:hypothetical protein